MIDRDFSCVVTNDRMRFMTNTVPQAVFQTANPRQSCAGPSLLEQMWATLLEELNDLMPGGQYHEDAFDDQQVHPDGLGRREWVEERARVQGACQGISACIALVLNPYLPDIDAVKAEAIARWTDLEANK
jgi:hypothetical protein